MLTHERLVVLRTKGKVKVERSAFRIWLMIKEQHCSTAEEFYNALSPTSEIFAKEKPRRWLFRGHDDDAYELLPSALRKKGRLAEITGDPCATNATQVWAEQVVLGRFFMIADQNGLALPEDSQQFRGNLKLYCGIDYRADITTGDAWPPSQMLSLTGLAQHYGTPTRLLDWTYQPLAAAYFAAEGAFRHVKFDNDKNKLSTDRQTANPSQHEKNLSVWAFNPDVHTANQTVGALRQDPRFAPVEIVSMPYAGNPNINAQQGAFTLYRTPQMRADDPVDRRPLDEVLSSFLRHVRDDLFVHLTLPTTQSEKLLFLLAKAGVSGATVYPGYQGVSRAVEESFIWADGTQQSKAAKK